MASSAIVRYQYVHTFLKLPIHLSIKCFSLLPGISLLVFLSLSTTVCVYVSLYTCACILRLEINDRCLALVFFILVFETWFLTELEAHCFGWIGYIWLDWLVNEFQERLPLLPSCSARVIDAGWHIQLCLCVLGI